jgi:TetR/AcrR family tetracycline transcriptional repressor
MIIALAYAIDKGPLRACRPIDAERPGALLAHRDAARVVLGTWTAEPSTVRLGALVVGILQSARFPADRAGWAGFTLGYYVLGHCIEEQSQLELVTAASWAAMPASIVNDGSYLDQALTATTTADPAERFDYGLRLVIDGIRAQIPA